MFITKYFFSDLYACCKYLLLIIWFMRQGTKIHATIGNLVVSDFQFLIRLGDCHFISNFIVKSNTDMLKLTSHPCKIHFIKKTHVKRCSDFADIQEPLNLLPFERFLGHRNDPKSSFGKFFIF